MELVESARGSSGVDLCPLAERFEEGRCGLSIKTTDFCPVALPTSVAACRDGCAVAGSLRGI